MKHPFLFFYVLFGTFVSFTIFIASVWLYTTTGLYTTADVFDTFVVGLVAGVFFTIGTRGAGIIIVEFRRQHKAKVPALRCAFCDKEVDEALGVYLDEPGVDGIFCNTDCAEAFIYKAVAEVDSENGA